MQLFSQLVAGLAIVSCAAWLVANWLTTSPRPVLSYFQKKSTWKLVEIPWLALAGASIIMAQQSFLVREHESEGRQLQAQFSMLAASFEMLTDQFYRQPSNQQSNSVIPPCSRWEGVLKWRDVPSDEPKEPPDFCEWLGTASYLMRMAQGFLHSLERLDPEDPSLSAGLALLQTSFRNPLSKTSPEQAREQANRIQEAHVQRKFDVFDIVYGAKIPAVCDFGMETSSQDDEREEAKRFAIQTVCWAGDVAAAYLGVMVRRSEAAIHQRVLMLWPLLLVLGLGFRIARTVAEYNLDRDAERKAVANANASSGATPDDTAWQPQDLPAPIAVGSLIQSSPTASTGTSST